MKADNIIRYSVIIPVYNSKSIISRCLNALETQTIDPQMYEVIVVDDGSADDTPEIIAADFPWVRVLPIKHGGPSVARNAGAQLARGEFLLFTDSDCMPMGDWIEKMIAPFGDPDIVGVKGVYRSHQPELIARFVQLEYQFKYERMAKLKWLDFIDTYSAAYRKEIFLKNKGFDSAFSVPSVEDQELSFRLSEKGYRLFFANDAIVYHIHDRNLGEYWKRKFGIGYWKAFMLRWIPQKTFKDSHTSPSQRWQIGLLGLSLIFLVLGIPFTWARWTSIICLSLFMFTGLKFFWFILRNDFVVGLISPFLLLLRAAALGSGLIKGFLFPPKNQKQKKLSLGLSRFFFKRIFDIIGSLFGIIFLSPIVAIAAVAIRLDSPGPAFFTQERAGENGNPFKVIKLRTMIYEAEEQETEELISKKIKGEKPKNDGRITRVGKLLRRWSIDEIPQLINVLRGEMSLIGPRPEEMKIVKFYTDEQRKRLAIKPGLTGPMQVNGRGELDIDQRLALEMDYIQNYSLWKDIKILFKTVSVIITGEGAF